jgi:hypothetical protein
MILQHTDLCVLYACMCTHTLQATPIALAGPRRHTVTGSLSSLSAHQYFPTETSSSTANNNSSSSNHNSNITAAALNALESLSDMPHADAVTEAHVVADVITDVLPRPLSIGYSSLHGGRGIQPVLTLDSSSGYRHDGFRNNGLVLPTDAPPSPLVVAASSEYEAWRSRANSATHDDHEDAGE